LAIYNINNSRIIFINNKYMMTIKKHLEQDSSRTDELSKILKRGTITLDEWRMTGKFISAEEYLHKNKDVALVKNCKEVIEYAGMSIIQVLHTGFFIFKDTKSKTLDEVENAVWLDISEKLWCDNC
jgi:hypothetical protein